MRDRKWVVTSTADIFRVTNSWCKRHAGMQERSFRSLLNPGTYKFEIFGRRVPRNAQPGPIYSRISGSRAHRNVAERLLSAARVAGHYRSVNFGSCNDPTQRIIEAAKMRHLRLFIMLALATGARSGAILDLTWGQISDRVINFNPVGRVRAMKARAIVPIGESVAKELDHARSLAMTDYVIEYGGKPVKSIKKAFETARDAAGLKSKKVTPHTLRHTAATWMAEEGIGVREIALLIGHRDFRTTENIYAKHSPEYLRQASGVLEAAIGTKISVKGEEGS